MIRHEKQAPATNRYQHYHLIAIIILSIMIKLRYGTLSKWIRYSYDGIRQLSTLDYSIAHIEKRSLYTHILVNFTRLATRTIDHLLNDVPENK
jgi:hypothetical protein